MSDPINQAFNEAGIVEPTSDAQPIYRVMADSKIPVSKSRGKLWKSRKVNGLKAISSLVEAWDEAIRYYNHDQSDHRDGSDPSTSGNRSVARRLNETHSATENVVFANVNAQLPELYAKNPVIEMTAPAHEDDEKWKQNNKLISQVEKLVNILFSMRVSPGINLKPKAKRAVVIALLTNNAWLEVGYVLKDMSSEQAMQQLAELSKELVNAKSAKEIEEVEGKIFAIEERVEFLRPSGPYVRIRMPGQVIVDPDTSSSDLSDSNWLMIEDMLPTRYINAVYGKKSENKDDDRTVSVYEATHILDGESDSDNDGEAVSLFDTQRTYQKYGFDSEDAFEKAKRTKVWYVWDKTTRRLELYSDANWTWPIWVWDDPYQLDQFFPLARLSFHENPVSIYAKGEVSYYLDQQDALNEINDEMRRALLWARRNIFFNKNVASQADVDAILSGASNKATGLDIPRDADPKNFIFSILPPSSNFSQLFNKQPVYQSIDRIAATNDVMRGAEFKTNTTNQAIDYYSTQGNKRADERLDAVEDVISQVGWLIIQLCLRFMPVETASRLIGEQIEPNDWQPIDPLEPTVLFATRCVGGSTTKPSVMAKKQEAVQVGQILSQYVRAAPGTVLTTTLRMFSEAFDGVVIHRDDWDMLAQEIAAQVGGSSEGGPPQAGGNPQQTQQNDPQQTAVMVTQALEKLPPQLLQAIGHALSRGARPTEILQQLASRSTNGETNNGTTVN